MGAEAPSASHPLSYRVSALRRALPAADSELDAGKEALLAGYLTMAGSALEAWLTPRADEIVSRTRTRFETWRLLQRPPDALVDFDALLLDVIKSDSIRIDAELVKFRLDVLSERVGEQRQDILGSVTSEMSELAGARSNLETFLLSRESREAPAAEESPAEEALQQEALEGYLLEAAAAAEQVVLAVIERAARSVLSQYAANLTRTELQLATTDGLAQVIDERLEISTEAATRLRGLLARMKGGSVGIAGPRGAGKSTIIRRFCDGRETIGERPLLSVMVPAPVVYDSRDFMLHLFAEVCRAAGAKPPPPEPTVDAQGQGVGWSFGWATALARSVAGWLPLLALWLIVGGAAALVQTTDSQVNDFLVWGVAVICAAGIPLISPYRWSNGDDRHGPRVLRRIAVVLVPFGLLLCAAGAADSSPSSATVKAAAVTVVGLVLFAVARDIQRAIPTPEPESAPQVPPRDTWPPQGDELERTASLRLEALRYQQSFKTGISGKIGLPVGLEIGASAERTLARHPMSFPEVVADFQRFLALAARTNDVLIAVDELDKLEADDDTANRFLNDLKAAFGVANTYFLVSVSEDAMSRFERRGLPFRDVFDSTFDEIVRVDPLSLAEAQQLLSERVVGFPYIYSGLCHVLAGGIPRDLIRTARRIIDVNERLGKPDTLSQIVRQLVTDELKGKTNAVEHAAIALEPPDQCLEAMLEWTRGFHAASTDRDNLLATAARLEESATLLEVGGQLTEDQAVARNGLLRLTLELGTYGYYVVTLLDFFQDTLTEGEIYAAANGGAADPALERLALARAAFGFSARTAWLGINAFRTTQELDPAELPAPAMTSASPRADVEA